MKLLAVWVMISTLPSVKCSAGGWAKPWAPYRAPSAAHGASPRRVIGVRSRESDDAVTAGWSATPKLSEKGVLRKFGLAP
jgi:hypothetical protein